MAPQSVDLVYLDPPFNSKRDYNAIYKDRTGRPLPDQVEAFNDTWVLDIDRMRVIKDMTRLLREHYIDGDDADFLAGFISNLVNVRPDMAAYLSYMAERLLWIKRIMKDTASIYLHCDPTASHYLKIVMDVVFGEKNFRSEIVWERASTHYLGAKQWSALHDVIFMYSNSPKWSWNQTFVDFDEEQIKKNFRHRDARGVYGPRDLTGGKAGGVEAYQPWREVYPSKGRAWALPKHERLPDWLKDDLPLKHEWEKLGIHAKLDLLDELDMIHWPQKTNGLPTLKYYLADRPGKLLGDNWTDIPPISATAKERLGYPTQKPVALMDRIVKASSNPGDVVFDPFCGCATTIESASKLGRYWIGIDITIHAIRRVARQRLQERLHLVSGKDYTIDGVPQNWEGAHALWKSDTYQFQKWCVEQVEGFVSLKRTADDGVDGRIYFEIPEKKVLQSMALEVKGGMNVGISDVRSLSSVLRRDNVLMAGLITLWEPSDRKSRNFRHEMARAGDVVIENRRYPRMQLLTVNEMLNGRTFDMPHPAGRSDSGYESDLFNVFD